MSTKTYDQYCTIAAALDLIGDRWTLLIMRELSFGEQRFTDLRGALPGIASNLLTERLRKLEDAGLVEQHELPAPAARTVYRLTADGVRIRPVLRAIAQFGLPYLQDPVEGVVRPRMAVFGGAGALFDAVAAVGESIRVRFLLDGDEHWLEVRDGKLRRADTTQAPDLTFTGSAARLLQLVRGADLDSLAPDLVVEGSAEAQAKFARLFRPLRFRLDVEPVETNRTDGDRSLTGPPPATLPQRSRIAAMDINGASAIVTGGASGIGAAVARQLAAKGAIVVIADLNAEAGEALAKEIGGAFVKVDVTNTEEIQTAVNTAVELAPLRALVNSAGIGWAQRTIGRDGQPDSAHNLDAFKKVIAINLIGTFDAVRLGATAMSVNEPNESGERGSIVNLASVAAFDGQIGQASYSASKGGVVGMTLPVARDLSSAGIRLNTVAPGLIDTPIYGEGEASEAFKANLGQNVLFPKRLGSPDELASMVVECVTNSYMNAEVIRVDGGIRMPPK